MSYKENKSLKSQLKDYFLSNKKSWFHKGTLLRLRLKNKQGNIYMGPTIGRALRNLESEKFLAVRPDKNGKSIEYRYLPEQLRDYYLNHSERPNGEKDKIFKVGMLKFNSFKDIKREENIGL